MPEGLNNGLAANALGTGIIDPVTGLIKPRATAGFNFSTGVVNNGAVPPVVPTQPEVVTPPNTGTEKGWWDKTIDAFTPQGDNGTSLGGNMMNAVGTGVGAVTGLAGMYYTKKNYDLQKDNQKYLQNREAQSDARKSAFATNAGNGAQY